MSTLPKGAGALVVVSVANPAAGAEWSATVPDQARWRVLNITFLYTSDANVASREILILWKRSAVTLGFVNAGQTCTANLGQAVAFNAGYGLAIKSVSDDIATGLPDRLLIQGGDVISSISQAIQVGDQYSAIRLLVEEWIEADE